MAVCSLDIFLRQMRRFYSSSHHCCRHNPKKREQGHREGVKKANFEFLSVHSIHLHIVTSALHVDTLAILAGELICKAGTQLEEDAGKIQAKCQQKW